ELKLLGADGNELEGGIVNTASGRSYFVYDKKIKKLLFCLIKDGMDTFDIKKACTSAADIARTIGIKEDEVEALTNTQFRLTVKNVNRLEEAELNDEFYTKVFGEGVVTSEAEFREKVKGEVEDMLVQNA